MSEEKKYGKEELDLINQLLDTYSKLESNISVDDNQNYIIKKHNSGRWLGVADNHAIKCIKFALAKVAKDNFDEDYIKEKLENQ